MVNDKKVTIEAEKFALALAALPTLESIAEFFNCDREDLLPLLTHEKVLNILEKNNLLWSAFWQLGMNHLLNVLTEEAGNLSTGQLLAQKNKNEAAKIFIRLAHDFRKDILKSYRDMWNADGEAEDPLKELQRDLLETIFAGKPDLSSNGRTNA